MLQFLAKFLYIVENQKYRLIILIVLFLLTSLLDTIGIGLIGPFISLASVPETVHKNAFLNWLYVQSHLNSEVIFIAWFGLIITIIFYTKSFLSYKVQRYVFTFSYDQKGRLCKRLLKAYLAAPYTFHLSRNTALLIQNIISETNNFCNGIMLPLLSSAAYAIVSIFLGLLLIKTDVTALLFILAMMLIPVSLYHQFKNKLAQWGKEASLAQVGMIRTINHSLGGLKETRIIGCEPYFENQIGEYVKGFEVAVSSSQTFKLLPRILIEAVLVTFLVGFTCIFLTSNRSTQNLTGVLGVFAIASIRLIPAITQMTNSIGLLRNNSYALNKIYFDLKEVEELNLNKNSELFPDHNRVGLSSHESFDEPLMHFADKIVLDEVTYSYPNVQETAIKGICLTIKKGQSIALIGKSGAGKTTLVDIILGLLEPQSGDIKVDGVSVYKQLRSWQNLIGYIPQSIFLMDDTVERNIAFGVPDRLIDSERLSKAIHDAQLTELIAELPDGVKTVIGERGVRLSGGQRQRMGIARVLYHQREILVLDEATSALDNETERLVNEAIKSLSGTKTLIIIAHRLTTVEHCDRIYLLEKGRIAKSGSYQEVVLGETNED
ncbi:MAG: ABC transporter ATP-binding protein/permease [Aphanothece sp. CMT-3BRIN-NPC111]|jgi:ABC-type multidrug transport system fused ATPase/permease subunit|nr:ABC transporter ATP-binding protein/permease [Aphanothece sp. CMT-3BRIN-NPC111]